MRNLLSFSALVLSMITFSTIDRAMAAENQIRLDGSSTVFPISEAIAEEFGAANPKIRVTVGTSGTGGGFKKFIAGEIDIANASRQIQESEAKDAAAKKVDYIELPVATDGLAVVVHPSNKFVNQLTRDQLKKIWEPGSKVQLWSDLDPSFPKEKIALFGPGPDSGTFDYFTEAVMGKARQSRSDYTASEDDNVLIKGIAGSKFAIGYFGHGYYMANKSRVKAVNIDWGKGAFEPTDENIANGKYGLSRPLFIYVSVASTKRVEVESFVNFYLKNVSSMAHQTGYLPLTADAMKAAVDRFSKKTTGKSQATKS
ncbi:MAG: PstS family phosphate ABC transporter substrate-binding protein [Proteobacteria bacterium]|nr:PstS family phosphate ABC transporter substrate-binding protein [Pseudomonadota bacterium]